ncbi:DUF4435 domain-containing protein [Arachidicoccus sp.]|uniref:DUF4435 domain-containing protein n=1 Tax=Arachidicoccus sp. TaxID=1872624 RepID=UPI003D243148
MGFPELFDSFLAGQDIFYAQFNDIEFYIEDTEQEHLYYNVLKILFPNIKFNKIFPLNGKGNVITESQSNVVNKKKVFVVDLDFDHILGTKVNHPNLFYLKKYSIENCLISKKAIYELIRLKDSKLKDSDIDQLFDYNDLLSKTADCLSEIASSFILIQQHSLGLSYYGLNTNRNFDFAGASPVYRLNFISDYLSSVENTLKTKKKSYTLRAQIRKLKTYFNTIINALSNIPGKYILLFIKDRLQALNLIIQMNVDSFTYALSKDFSGNELNYLKTSITNYIT